MENTLVQFGTTLVLGGFFVLSIAGIVCLAKPDAFFRFCRQTNFPNSLVPVIVLILSFVCGMLLEDSSAPLFKKFPSSIFPKEQNIRAEVFYDSPGFASTYAKEKLLLKILNKEPISAEDGKSKVAFDEKSKKWTICTQYPLDPGCFRTIADTVYFHAKNCAYRENSYFKELSAIEDRMQFARSLCLAVLLLFLLTIGMLAFRIKRPSLWRPSWIVFAVLCGVFFVIFFAGREAYKAEEGAYARRVFGYYLSLKTEDATKSADSSLIWYQECQGSKSVRHAKEIVCNEAQTQTQYGKIDGDLCMFGR